LKVAAFHIDLYGGERSHDLPECVWLFWHIRAGMKVVHCGAHHGFLTIPFSKALVCNRIGNPHIEGKTARLPISNDIGLEKQLPRVARRRHLFASFLSG